MSTPLRVIATLAALLGAYFVIWLTLVTTGTDAWLPAEGGLSLLAACGLAWWVWQQTGHAQRSVTSAVVSGAAIVGGIGFALGFFGPMILAPDANQGPMLGIFVTGPGGAVLGALGGLVVGLRHRRPKH